MTRKSAPGINHGISWKLKRAFKQDLGAIARGQEHKATKYLNLAKKVSQNAEKFPGGKKDRKVDKQWDTMCALSKKLKIQKRIYEELYENHQEFFKQLKAFVYQIRTGAFDKKGNWKPGVRDTSEYSRYFLIQNLAPMRIEIARLAQTIYPNSIKTAPRHGYAVWNGMRKTPRTSKGKGKVKHYFLPPWSDYVIQVFRDKTFFSTQYRKTRDGDPYYDKKRSEDHKDTWEGIKKPDRIWLTAKYKCDNHYLTLSESFKLASKKLFKKPKKAKESDAQTLNVLEVDRRKIQISKKPRKDGYEEYTTAEKLPLSAVLSSRQAKKTLGVDEINKQIWRESIKHAI